MENGAAYDAKTISPIRALGTKSGTFSSSARLLYESRSELTRYGWAIANRVGRNFAWLPDGPFRRHFRAQLEANFFESRFDGRGEHLAFVNGMLSRNSNAVIQHHMRRLEAEFTELHNQDVGLPLEERFGSSIFIAMPPWVPDVFKKLQRKPTHKQF